MGRLKQFRRRITYSDRFISVLSGILLAFIILYYKTLKVRIVLHPEMRKLDRKRLCYGFWHGRQFLLIPGCAGWPTALMTDISWAGAIQTKILDRMGYRVVRGSSKRKGAQALIALKKVMLEGYSPALALDGPRGPVYRSKPGLAFLAQKFDYPVIPVTTASDKYWILKRTWCQYMLPKPFSRCLIVMGQPIQAERGIVDCETIDRILILLTGKTDDALKRLNKH